MRDIYADNADRFRLFCPDETNSNRLGAVFEVTDRAFAEAVTDDDVSLSRDGRVMEVLSRAQLPRLAGGLHPHRPARVVRDVRGLRHGERVDDHPARQVARRRPSGSTWRAEVPSLNVLLTSTAWRNDHNGFSHQGPGLIQNVITIRGTIGRIYLPPDANCLLSVADHCLRSRSYVNLVVIDKQPQLQWLTIDEAERALRPWRRHLGVGRHRRRHDRSRHRARVRRRRRHPGDGCRGADPERAAARLRTRVVNVVDLMSLPRRRDHPHGMSSTLFSELFTDTVDVVFAFHGYPGAMHQLVHGRPDADRFRVRGFVEEGTTTTPFDMVVRNRVSRYHLVMDALNNARRTVPGSAELMDWCRSQISRHEAYVVEHLEDMPEVRNWTLDQPIEEA